MVIIGSIYPKPGGSNTPKQVGRLQCLYVVSLRGGVFEDVAISSGWDRFANARDDRSTLRHMSRADPKLALGKRKRDGFPSLP